MSLCYHDLWFRGGGSRRSPRVWEQSLLWSVEDREAGLYEADQRHLPVDFSPSYQGVFQGEAWEALPSGSVLNAARSEPADPSAHRSAAFSLHA